MLSVLLQSVIEVDRSQILIDGVEIIASRGAGGEHYMRFD